MGHSSIEVMNIANILPKKALVIANIMRVDDMVQRFWTSW